MKVPVQDVATATVALQSRCTKCSNGTETAVMTSFPPPPARLQVLVAYASGEANVTLTLNHFIVHYKENEDQQLQAHIQVHCSTQSLDK